MSGLKDKYGLLPEVPEHVVDKLLHEVGNFATMLKHDPQGVKRSLYQGIEWLKKGEGFSWEGC